MPKTITTVAVAIGDIAQCHVLKNTKCVLMAIKKELDLWHLKAQNANMRKEKIRAYMMREYGEKVIVLLRILITKVMHGAQNAFLAKKYEPLSSE